MSEIDPEFLKQLQEAFVIEGREQLQNIMANIISLENSANDEEKKSLSEDILRDLHSLKGNSRAAGALIVEAVCQSFESAILSLRRKRELLNADAADIFHKSIDLLDELISNVESGNPEHSPASTQEILQFLKYLDERNALSSGALAADAANSSKAAVNSEPRTNVEAPLSGIAEQADPGTKPAQNHQKQEGGKHQQPATGTDKSASTRIALWKLNKLLRESEEMLIFKQISEQHLDDLRDFRTLSKQLKEQVQHLEKTSKDQKHADMAKTELQELAEKFSKLCTEMEQALVAKSRRQQTEQRLCFNMVDGFIDSVKSMLMQDFSSLLSIVPKLVRDLSRELKKEVDLEVFGTEIEIDRRILEEIKDPLIHLVRNSLDHGIELPEQRLAKGKAAKASLRVGASQDESGQVQLVIMDDGKGINADKLKSVALRDGVITAEEASRMTENEAIELMYRSSVSTSETVNEISGRGLGMPIVRERIHELGGRIIVESKLEKGTTFIIKLPTKLSTFRGIQVTASKQSFIIPTLNVHYAGRIMRTDIKQSAGKNIATINGQLVSIQNLADVLRIKPLEENRSRLRQYQQLLVLESNTQRAGFLVDEIMHEHEVLVRGLSYPLVRVANVAGATILGSGQVVPVLNIADLMETSAKASWADEKLMQALQKDHEQAKKVSRAPIFLVDCQNTSMIILKGMLESEGYNVHAFESNEAALAGLEGHSPMLLLKSSELPETEESGLASWVRKNERLKNLPIVFFGTHNFADGEQFAAKSGGNGYFSRVNINRRMILELIEGLT